MTYGQERLRDSPLTKVLLQRNETNGRIVTNSTTERGEACEQLYIGSENTSTDGSSTTSS